MVGSNKTSCKKYASVFRKDLFLKKVILVTGGGSGIGRCVAYELASLGATVVVAGRVLQKLTHTVQKIQQSGGHAYAVSCDVREETQVQKLGKFLTSSFSQCHGLVHCAGGQFASLLSELSSKGFDAVLRNNITGTFLVIKELAKIFRDQKTGGSIVCVLANFFRGMPYLAHTGAARAAIDNLIKTAAVEWSPDNIRVNGVAPGIVDSGGLKNYAPDYQQILQKMPEQIPARRFGTESELSSFIVYLLSPAATYITGETLRIDGGLYLSGNKFPAPTCPPWPAFQASPQENIL